MFSYFYLWTSISTNYISHQDHWFFTWNLILIIEKGVLANEFCLIFLLTSDCRGTELVSLLHRNGFCCKSHKLERLSQKRKTARRDITHKVILIFCSYCIPQLAKSNLLLTLLAPSLFQGSCCKLGERIYKDKR